MTTLITGGMGFIGLHTARAFVDAGEDVVITWYHTWREPAFLKEEYGKRVQVEQADVSQGQVILDLARKHRVDSILHLAVPGLGQLTPAEEFRVNMDGLLSVLEASREAGVERLTLASSITVYAGLPKGPFLETDRLPVASVNSTETYKKAWEILAESYGKAAGLEVVSLRIGMIYGPLYHSMYNLPSRLAHAAVSGAEADYTPHKGGVPFREDATDYCYVKDCAEGIWLVHTAGKLEHAAYNIGGGQPITNGRIHDAVLKVKPDARLQIQEGRGPRYREDAYMDLSRTAGRTGYSPRYTPESAMADYIAWLEEGNQY